MTTSPEFELPQEIDCRAVTFAGAEQWQPLDDAARFLQEHDYLEVLAIDANRDYFDRERRYALTLYVVDD